MNNFKSAAIVQIRVIGALMMRDLVYQANRGAVPLFYILIRPMLIVGAIYLIGFTAMGGAIAPAGFPYMVFVISSLVTWFGFVHCLSYLGVQGLNPLLIIPRVTPLDLMLARVGIEFFIQTVLLVIYATLGIIFEHDPLPADPLGVLLAFWSAISIGLTLGVMFAVAGRFTDLPYDLSIAIRMVGHALSGVFALATATPQVFLNYLQWNPLFHSVEWMREAWWPTYKSPIASPAYVGEFLFFMLAISLAAERATRRWQTK